MNTKHRPGPWYAAQPGDCGGWWVVSTDPDGDDCVDASGDGGFEEADARLIAAAPEMLAALEALLELHIAHHNAPQHAAARAAIAKARGE